MSQYSHNFHNLSIARLSPACIAPGWVPIVPGLSATRPRFTLLDSRIRNKMAESPCWVLTIC